MPQDPEQLQSRVDELRRRVVSEGNVSPELRELLLQFLSDLESNLVEQPRPAGASSPTSLASRVLSAGEHFEDSHPLLSETIGNLADVLSRMGI